MNIGRAIMAIIGAGFFMYGGYSYGQATHSKKPSSEDRQFLGVWIGVGFLFIVIAIFG